MHAQTALARQAMSKQRECFNECITFLHDLRAGNFPSPAKEVIVSHPVNAYSPTIASHTRLVRPDDI